MRIVCVIAACALVSAASVSAEEIENTRPAEPRGEVEIFNTAGEVKVIGWERAEIHITGDLGEGVEKLDIRGEGKRTSIKVILPKGRTSRGGSDLTIHIPRESTLNVQTVSADQTVSEVRNVQRLQTVSGTIMSERWNADFEGRSVSGEITVRGHNDVGVVRVTTVSGNVSLQDIGREVELNTVTGDMSVRTRELSRLRAKTTNGDLELRAKLGKGGTVETQSINGDVRLRFGSPVSAQFDIETFNGDIDNCFGEKATRKNEFAPGNELRFSQGEGDGQVRIKTLNGGVEVCKD
jgi:DUF4097 and DUF4098 domain-containing protein YvlB